jgi:hypothetical protein
MYCMFECMYAINIFLADHKYVCMILDLESECVYICMLYIYEYIRTVYSVCIMFVCIYVQYACMYHVISIKKVLFF